MGCRGHQPSPSTGNTAPWEAEQQHDEGCLELWICCFSFQSYSVEGTASLELLSLCDDLHSLQQALHTLIMPLFVPRTDLHPARVEVL